MDAVDRVAQALTRALRAGVKPMRAVWLAQAVGARLSGGGSLECAEWTELQALGA